MNAMAQATRRRKAANATTTQRTVRLNVAIPSATWERLAINSTMTRRTQAEIITELVETHLRSYRVQCLEPRESDQPADSTTVALPIESSATATV
jgi:macrodomain Ter protein organizer (MatP/YcbG family)